MQISQLRKTKRIVILIRVTNSRFNGFQSYAIFLIMGFGQKFLMLSPIKQIISKVFEKDDNC